MGLPRNKEESDRLVKINLAREHLMSLPCVRCRDISYWWCLYSGKTQDPFKKSECIEKTWFSNRHAEDPAYRCHICAGSGKLSLLIRQWQDIFKRVNDWEDLQYLLTSKRKGHSEYNGIIRWHRSVNRSMENPLFQGTLDFRCGGLPGCLYQWVGDKLQEEKGRAYTFKRVSNGSGGMACPHGGCLDEVKYQPIATLESTNLSLRSRMFERRGTNPWYV